MSRAIMRTSRAMRATVPVLPRVVPLWSPKSALLFKVAPALHGDFAGVEFALSPVAILVRALDVTGSLTRVSPGEIVKVPEGVHWQDEVPDWEREQVDQHPQDIGETVCGDDDQHSG